MRTTKCRAKNPATCRTHGFATKGVAGLTVKPTAEEVFAAALASNPRIAALEAQVKFTQQKVESLAGSYQAKGIVPAEEFAPLAWRSPELTSLNEEFEQVSAQWTEEERNAVSRYTAIGYRPIRDALTDSAAYRARFEDEDRYIQQHKLIQQEIRHLDSALAKYEPSEQPRSLYRVITQDLTQPFTGSEEFARKLGLVEGNEVAFESYSSTTLDPGFVNRYTGEGEQHISVVVHMKTNKGVPVSCTAVEPSDINYTQDTERELLLPRGTRWKVTKVSRAVFHSNDHDPIEPLTAWLEEV